MSETSLDERQRALLDCLTRWSERVSDVGVRERLEVGLKKVERASRPESFECGLRYFGLILLEGLGDSQAGWSMVRDLEATDCSSLVACLCRLDLLARETRGDEVITTGLDMLRRGAGRRQDIVLRVAERAALLPERRELALEFFLEAAGYWPSDSEILYGLAQTYFDLGRFAEAVPWYERALECNSFDDEEETRGLAEYFLEVSRSHLE